MHKILNGYSLLAVVSFCFFSVCFHTVANAQAPTDQLPIIEQESIPTPTIFVIQTPTPLPFFGHKDTPSNIQVQPTIAVIADLEILFNKFASEYHIDSEVLKKIARCESGFNTSSNNSDLYLGMFQFAEQTWVSTRAAMGRDTNPSLRTNPEESIKTAAFMIARGQQAAWPNCH